MAAEEVNVATGTLVVTQEGYVTERGRAFAAMLDAVAELLPATFVALDLACGPGSISQRLLDRFPARERSRSTWIR